MNGFSARGRHTLGARVGLALAATLLMAPTAALAHPLGNFNINHYTSLRTDADAVSVRYVVDLAEIPTFQEVQEGELVPEAGHPSVAAYLARRAEALKDGLRLEADGRRLALRVESSDIAFAPGAGGLPTMRVEVVYCARLDGAGDTVRLSYHDGNDTGRAGWREIVASAGPRTALAETSAPGVDRSRGLTDYPPELLQRPPQDVAARIVFTREAPTAAAAPRSAPAPAPRTVAPAPASKASASSMAPSASREAAVEVPRSAPASSSTGLTIRPASAPGVQRAGARSSTLADLVTTSGLGLGIALSALAIAAGLGALHALEPGHGKTVVAAYLVGARGTTRHAVILGLIVTASHTAGVYLLGAATLYASQYVVPDRLYPWLAAGSGLAIAALGAMLFLRHLAGREIAHHHGHERAHDHADQSGHDHHAHGHAHHHHQDAANVTLGQLFTLGVSGGIVPCPAALVVLLSAISLRRVGFGLLLVATFSAGLAAVLVAIGLLMVHGRRLAARFTTAGPLVQRWLPLASSTVVAVFGVAMAVQALAGS